MSRKTDPGNFDRWLDSQNIHIKTPAWAVSAMINTIDGWRMQVDVQDQPGEMRVAGTTVRLSGMGLRPGRNLCLRITYVQGHLPHIEVAEHLPGGLLTTLHSHVEYDVDNNSIIIYPTSRTNAARTTYSIFTKDRTRRHLPRPATPDSIEEWAPPKQVRPILGY